MKHQNGRRLHSGCGESLHSSRLYSSLHGAEQGRKRNGVQITEHAEKRQQGRPTHENGL